jgi:D-xylonolactonase
MEPEVVADYLCETGEGPLWHPMEKRVYWADIPRGRIFRLDPASGQHEEFWSGAIVGGFTIQQDGSLLLFMEKGGVAVLKNGELNYVIDELPDERDTRFNDVIADPQGRVFCGTMPTASKPGTLYRLDLDGSITPVVKGVGISNGLGFTPDRKQVYYTDSTARQIYLFDYDELSGGITNKRVFLETPEGEGIPDGMTVDAQGFVWSARWDGWSLYRYSPQGIEERRVEFPAKKVSSVIFAGDDLTDMYVTTAGGHDRQGNGPHAGALFKLNPGIKGSPEFLSRIGI